MTVLPTIGLIAVSFQRLLPSASRISNSIINIRRYKPLVYIVKGRIDSLSKNKQHEIDKKKAQKIRFEHSLELSNVCYRYANSESNAIDKVSLEIPKNSSFAIVGESGAGKSTLVDILLGLLPIKIGSIRCDDIEIATNSDFFLSSMVGYVPQQVSLLDATIKENIAFGVESGNIDEVALNRALSIAQLEMLIAELPDGVNTEIGEKGSKLSGGQCQRIGIARALYRDPEILIMDEATNALDAATESDFNNALQALMGKKTLIIIAHRLTSVQICDQIVQLEKGKIVASGSYKELLAHSDAFRRIYNLSPELAS